MSRTALVYSEKYLQHRTHLHPEKSERLTAIIERLQENHLWERLSLLPPRPASLQELMLVHEREYVRRVESACRRGVRRLDADTMISSRSYQAALLAAGGVLRALDALLSGEIENAFCALRPPGHHAERNRAMGFCLFNNVAIAARYAQRKYALGRVLIIDWDAHHGNGTQNAFYGDDSVFYCSLHQYPHYPGSGAAHERGRGRGEGFTLNLPLRAGSGDEQYLRLFEERLLPAATAFEPELILLSAGFDAHRADPISGLAVSSAGFARLSSLVKELAASCCRGRLISVLEGGYDLRALAEAVEAHLQVLAAD